MGDTIEEFMNFKLLKSTGIYTLLGFIPLVSSFVLLPVYTQFLTASDYGIVSLAGVMESYLLILITFGLQSAFTIYYFDYLKVENGINKLLSVVLLSILSISLIYAVILFFGGEEIYRLLWDESLPFEQFGWFIFSNSIVLSLNQILFQYYRVSENLKKVMLTSLVPFFGSTLGGIIGIVILNGGALGSVVGKSIGILLASIPFYLILFKRIGFYLDLNIIRKIFTYAYPFVLIFLITNLSETSDRLIMNHYFDLKILGLYAFSMVIVSPIRILLQSYWNSVTPTMYRAVSEDNPDKKKILQNNLSGVLIITLISIWGLIMIVDPVVKFIANSTYHSAVYYVPLLAITIFGRAYTIMYTFNATFYKKTKYLPLVNIISLILGVGFALLLVDSIGIWAIFIAVILSRLSQGVLAYIIDRWLGFNDFPIMFQLPLVLLTLFIVFVNYAFVYDIKGIHIGLVNLFEALFFFLLLFMYNKQFLKATYYKLVDREKVITL